jgi:SAM-dependent methyltransferase
MFTDERLTALYDSTYPHIEDTSFYVALARDLAAHDVIDLGCGTGRLALRLAAIGCNVTGIDPSLAMLKVARSKPGAADVTWIEGDASDLAGLRGDLVLMTGHVAQFFLQEADWLDALSKAREALRPHGHLAFETRNPLCEPWRMWTRELSHRTTALPSGPVETWYEVASVRDRHVTYSIHYHFPSGEEVRDDNVLIFRTHDEIAASLVSSGYSIERTYGNWDLSALSADSPELIYVAGVQGEGNSPDHP